MLDYSANRTRRHYRYALFSTSGFSSPAQNYALAHQISLVDLSGPEWADLVDVANQSASEFLDQIQLHGRPFPVNRLRQTLRQVLGTSLTGEEPTQFEHDRDSLRLDLRMGANRLAATLREIIDSALLIFPASGQVQLARPESLQDFIARVTVEPEHQVTLSVARQ